jgi:hypothetical protein
MVGSGRHALVPDPSPVRCAGARSDALHHGLPDRRARALPSRRHRGRRALVSPPHADGTAAMTGRWTWTDRPDWQADAACRDVDAAVFFLRAEATSPTPKQPEQKRSALSPRSPQLPAFLPGARRVSRLVVRCCADAGAPQRTCHTAVPRGAVAGRSVGAAIQSSGRSSTAPQVARIAHSELSGGDGRPTFGAWPRASASALPAKLSKGLVEPVTPSLPVAEVRAKFGEGTVVTGVPSETAGGILGRLPNGDLCVELSDAIAGVVALTFDLGICGGRRCHVLIQPQRCTVVNHILATRERAA